MQRYTISRNNIYDETMTLFSLSKVYTKPKEGVTPLIEVNSIEINDSFDNNNDYSKFISVFNLDGDNIFDISVNDLMELSDLYIGKEQNNRNIDDINILSLHRFDDIKQKLENGEMIIFNVSAFYQEIKTDEVHGNTKYKEYQSYYSELEDKANFAMSDDFFYNNSEYATNTLFIYADYNQSDFIILSASPNKCLVKLPVSNDHKLNIGSKAVINVKSTLKFDNAEILDTYTEEVTILAKTSEKFTIDYNTVTRNYVIFLMDCSRDVKVDSLGLIYAQNPLYKSPAEGGTPQKALIPYLYLYVNPRTHKFYPSYTTLGLDYVSKSFPLYYIYQETSEEFLDITEKLDIFTLLGENNTEWDYINDTTIRLPLPNLSEYLTDECVLPIKKVLKNILSEENIVECEKMDELIAERQTKESVSGNVYSLFSITDKFNTLYGKQPSFFHHPTTFTKDLFDKNGVPLAFKGFSDNDNELRSEIFYEALFKMTIYNPPVRISLPISQTFDIDAYQDEVVKDNYLSSLTGSQVNGIVDMERDCYHPMWYAADGFKEIKQIKYHFHFKKRDSNYQLIKEEGNNYWIDNLQQYRSDLLGEIGFSNRDVYYQKNALKKSFMRSTYYNTPSTANQDALCYNTSFIDYRKLYQTLVSNPDASVNKSVSDLSKRLDSTITINDKYSSKNSSEGFYIYIWRGTEKIELYNAIEFNNAKYGVTSPMMLAKIEDMSPVFPDKYQDLVKARHIKWIAEYNQDLNKHIFYIDPVWLSGWNGCIRFADGTLEIGLWEINLKQN